MIALRQVLRSPSGTDHDVEASLSPDRTAVSVRIDGGPAAEVPVRPLPGGGWRLDLPGGSRPVIAQVAPGFVEVSLPGRTLRFERRADRAATGRPDDAAGAEARTPMPGRVVEVRVKPGDAVAQGDTVAVVEAMKLANPVAAPRDGVVADVAVAVGDQVAPGALLVRLVPEEAA